jgi:predicted regulator of Ras-like GTPase activity (Roadblock/LC7/MglB family)/CheY-like chemotaxis protein
MSPQILLIEGEETQAIAVQRILEPTGYEVVWAATLQEVIDFLNQSERPVVVSSLRFAPLDVFSLLRWLVVNRSQARLLVLSEDIAPPVRTNGALSFVSLRALSRLCSLVSDALAGHLPAVSFADLIDVVSLLVLTRSTQRLHVIFDQQQGYLYIWQGQILHAQTETQAGIEAFSEILRWTGGGVYELPWEAPLRRSLQEGEAEAVLLGSRQPIEPSEEGLLSILEDAVERSIDTEPAPEIAPQEPTFSAIEQDFITSEKEAPAQTPEWPVAEPEQILEAIEEPHQALLREVLDAVKHPPTDVPPSTPEAPSAYLDQEPKTPVETTRVAEFSLAQDLDLTQETPSREDDTPQPLAPVTQAEVLLTEPSDEAIPAEGPLVAQALSSEEQVEAIQQELTKALREDASSVLQQYNSPSQEEHNTQSILAQEALLSNSLLAELLQETKPLSNSSASLRALQGAKADDIASSEMEEAPVEEMGAIVTLAKEENEPQFSRDVWAELSQEMEVFSRSAPTNAEPNTTPEPSPFEPPKLELAPPTERDLEATPAAAEGRPFLPTPSYRETPSQKPGGSPTDPELELIQTPPLGTQVTSKMTAHTQMYNIAPPTPPDGMPMAQKNEEDAQLAEIRTPRLGTLIVTPPKTPALGIPIHQVAVPFIPPPNAPRTSPTLNNTPRTLNTGTYPAQNARTPSGMYRAIPSAESESDMFSNYLTPPFGVRIPKTPNAEQTPLAPTGSPLANAARSALQERPATASNGPIADLVPVLESVAREVPEFIAAIAFETDSGMTLGGVSSRTDLDAEGGFAYYAEVLRLLRPAISLFDASFEELLVTSPKWYILVRPLREEFFLGLITTRRGNLGICRIVLKRAASQLLERLPTKEYKVP